MVLEELIDALRAEAKPWKLFFLGALYASVAMGLSLWIFKPYASLVMIFLTVLATVPLIMNTLKVEEAKDLAGSGESILLKEHGKALSFLIFMFLGFTLAFTFWYVILPADLTLTLFSIQAKTINEINTQITGQAIQQFTLFSKIFFNNMKVLIFCLIFSFLYGSGALFILTWNASVIATAIGNFIRSNISEASSVMHYFEISSLGIMRYFIHGVPEILAYFLGGLAAGIISIAVINHDFGSKKFRSVIMDSADLLLLAIITLIFAALIEVFVTPVLF
ncbi:stage II sporulation protein M [Candidatus Woesearchaeota archaeon]|nr:stage II sporulation protein M [Candidatus Woesearchaeota archaeon]